jgi:putative ABC transport system permease protein
MVKQTPKDGTLMNIFSLSLKNLRRKPVRTAAIFMGMAALAGLLFTLTSFYLSVNRSIERSRARLGADAMVVPAAWGRGAGGVLLSGGAAGAYMDASVKERLKALEEVEAASSQLYIVSAPLECCSVSDVLLVGFEPEEDFTITPWIKENLKKPLSPDEVVAGSNILAEPGGRMQFYGEVFLIAGKLEPTGMEFIDSAVFIPMESARRMIAASAEKAEIPLDIQPGGISAVMLAFREGVDHEKEALKIEYALPGHRVVLASRALREARLGLLAPIKSIAAAGVIQWAVSLMLTGALYGAIVEERRKEIGIMRAMGATYGHVLRMFLYEALVLSLAGGAVGLASGTLFIAGFRKLLTAFLAVPFVFPPAPEAAALAAGTLLFALLSGLAAAFFPVRLALRTPPHETLGA